MALNFSLCTTTLLLLLLLLQMTGVVDCVVGYGGGVAPDPTYQNIQDYTEALLVEYNPEVVSYRDVLKEWSTMDYPLVPQKKQYRSALFCINEMQLEQARDFVQGLHEKYSEKGQVYVDVEPISAFYRAEEYHQDFLAKQKQSRTLKMF